MLDRNANPTLPAEPLFGVRGAKEHSPTARCAHEVVRCVEAGWRLIPPRDVPQDIDHGEVRTLFDERAKLEARREEAIRTIKIAESHHVLADWFERGPVLVPCVRSDARWNCVERGDSFAFKRVKRVSVLLEKRVNFCVATECTGRRRLEQVCQASLPSSSGSPKRCLKYRSGELRKSRVTRKCSVSR